MQSFGQKLKGKVLSFLNMALEENICSGDHKHLGMKGKATQIQPRHNRGKEGEKQQPNDTAPVPTVSSYSQHHTLSSAEDSQDRLCSSAAPNISLAEHIKFHSCFYNDRRRSAANQQSSLQSGNLGTQTSVILSLGYTELTALRGSLRGKQEPGHSTVLSTSAWMALISSP